MRSGQFAALALAAVVAVAAIAPVSAAPAPVVSTAAPAFRPNVGVTFVLASTVSVILDAIYIASTQCREMTAQEAVTAVVLPGVGGIYNATLPSQSKCKK